MTQSAAYDDAVLASLLPYPAKETNKYLRGKLFVVAGSAAYPGAAGLAATAAQRMGAGYVEVITHPRAVPLICMMGPSLVVRSWEGWLAQMPLPLAQPLKPAAVLLGPGFDAKDPFCADLTLQVLESSDIGVVIDGGALSVAASLEGCQMLKQRAALGRTTVLTPHGGEATRFVRPLRLSFGLDACTLAQEIAREFKAAVAFKGPDTFCADGREALCEKSLPCISMTGGTAALAKAGAGDVLAGMVGALLAQGMDAFDALVLATTLHARSAQAAAEDLSEICVIPEDVIAYLPKAIAFLADAL